MESFRARHPRVSVFLILSRTRKGLHLHADDSEQEKPLRLDPKSKPRTQGQEEPVLPRQGAWDARSLGEGTLAQQWQQKDQVWGLSLK